MSKWRYSENVFNNSTKSFTFSKEKYISEQKDYELWILHWNLIMHIEDLEHLGKYSSLKIK